MNKFWKVTLAVIVGCIITNILIAFIFFGIIGSSLSNIDKTEVVVKDNSVLKISLDEDMPDKVASEYNTSYTSFGKNKAVGLNDALKTIEKAKNDNKIKGIYLDLSSANVGFATAEELRNKLAEFKESGKFIVSYSTAYSQLAYYIASVSDEIYLNPQGAIDWKGMCSQIMFYKNALAKVGVEMQVFRHGQFKSAVEPYICDKMSDANRKQYSVLLNTIWSKMCAGISEQRQISVEELNKCADGLLVRNADKALEYKFIDGVKYYDEVLNLLQNKSGFVVSNDDKDAKVDDMFIGLAKYQKADVLSLNANNSKNEIAVLFAEGEIVDGKGGNGQIGGDGLSEQIRKIRENDDIKALVLRVNSPGGSGLASEIIWRELVKTKDAGKKIVVSMGNYAASGGYYISCPADYIFAQPTTLTGSIGVFGMFPNVQGLVTEKIGINIDQVCTNESSDFGTIMRPVTEKEYNYVLESIEDFYQLFISRVYNGRSGKGAEGQVIDGTAAVDSIGQGRVWAGADAIAIGLVDEIGGLNDAVKKAVEMAGLSDYKIVEFPETKGWKSILSEEFDLDISTRIMQRELGADYEYYKQLQQIKNTTGIQARMEYGLTFVK